MSGLRVAAGDPIDPEVDPALCPHCFMGQHEECSGPCDCRHGSELDQLEPLKEIL